MLNFSLCTGKFCITNLSPAVNRRPFRTCHNTALGVIQGHLLVLVPILLICWLRLITPLKPAVRCTSTASRWLHFKDSNWETDSEWYCQWLTVLAPIAVKPRSMTYSLDPRETADLFAFQQFFLINLPMQRCNAIMDLFDSCCYLFRPKHVNHSLTCRQTRLQLLHFQPMLLYPFGTPRRLWWPWIQISIIINFGSTKVTGWRVEINANKVRWRQIDEIPGLGAIHGGHP